jgi:Cytochrome P450
VKPEFPDVADYDLQARSVLFELTGALVLIVGKTLGEMAAFATSPEGQDAGIGWDTLVARLADGKATQQDHDATVNEVLRLAGGSRLTRTVRSDCQWRGVDLKAGDRVVVLVNAASRDPAAFPDPARFAPDPARPYITSGPLQGPHLCYGRGIAWTILREAIAATQGRIAPANAAKIAVFAGLPDDLPFIALRR